MRIKGFILIAFCILFLSCQKDNKPFKHHIQSDQKPWTNEAFDTSDGKFSFVVFGDLTGGEREDVFNEAVSKINLLRPELIVNVGDLIEGAQSDSIAWVKQWEDFDARANQSKAPVFYAGGNHDLTGNLGRSIWESRYGNTYYHFVYKNNLFLVLDSEDYGPEGHDYIEKIRNEAVDIFKTEGQIAYSKTAYANLPERRWGKIGKAQSDYFVNTIKQHPDVNWIFVLVHKEVWENPEAQDFFRIEKALEKHNYTVFYGHTHVYDYNSRNERDYINLATTGGQQFPDKGFSEDHVIFVTVDSSEVSIANIMLSGILGKDEIHVVK